MVKVKVVERSVLLEWDEGPDAKAIEATAPSSRFQTVAWLGELATRVRNGEISLERAMLAVKWIGERNGRQESHEAFAPLLPCAPLRCEGSTSTDPRGCTEAKSKPGFCVFCDHAMGQRERLPAPKL